MAHVPYREFGNKIKKFESASMKDVDGDSLKRLICISGLTDLSHCDTRLRLLNRLKCLKENDPSPSSDDFVNDCETLVALKTDNRTMGSKESPIPSPPTKRSKRAAASSKSAPKQSKKPAPKAPKRKRGIPDPAAFVNVDLNNTEVYSDNEVDLQSEFDSESDNDHRSTFVMETAPRPDTLYAACKLLDHRVEKFSGNDEKTFVEFLEEYDEIINSLHIPLSHAMTLFPLYLTSGAKQKYQSLTAAEKVNWRTMVTALAKKFKTQAAMSNARDELHNLRQGKEPIADFAKKVKAKTKMAFQGEDPSIPDRLAIDFFIKGLRPELRRAIRRLPESDNFDVIMAYAEKEERLQQQERLEDGELLASLNSLALDNKMSKLEAKVNHLRAQPNNRKPYVNHNPRPQNSGFPLTSADYQICGTNPYANILTLPPPIQCTVSPDESIIDTKVTLYAERNDLLEIEAYKCYRDLVNVEVSNFLYIRTSYHVVGRQRLSVSTTDCRDAITHKTINGHTLTETVPGLLTTKEIDEEHRHVPLFGTTIYARSTYSIEKDIIAIVSEDTLISPLGNLDNCTLSEGACSLDDAVVIWKTATTLPSCRMEIVGTFEAIATLRYVLIPEHELAFQFDTDQLKAYDALQFCSIKQGYLSTSNHILSFPDIPNHLMLQDFIIQQASMQQRKEMRHLTLADNRTSGFELIPEEPSLIVQIFGASVAPTFATHPITDPRILHAIRQWNVTNRIFNRSRLYDEENQWTSALRSIRYAEYRTRQLNHLSSIMETRPLNYAENVLQRDLQETT
ncbi:unnamed protein product [Nippostrongylus brasiliensis]|uniref:Retrotrans_gag domain-containing protein n=1 Tax=Nippostrongylus brasiliensis TaxID=27835 RepID=A0A0N4Y4Y7_NIPBR|nr:unnamed protein product [Nippostrongylus brasiliensis]